MRGQQTAAPGVASDLPPGRWVVRVAIEPGSLEARAVPVELALQTLDPNEEPGTALQPGKVGSAPAPAASATPSPSRAPSSSSSSGAVVPVTGVVALLAGLFGGFAAARRRHS